LGLFGRLFLFIIVAIKVAANLVEYLERTAYKGYKGDNVQKELTTLPIGAVIRGRYIVEGLLGKGDSGAIYLVRDQHIRHAKDNLFVLKQVKGPSQQRWYQLIQHWYRLNFEGASLNRLYHQALPRIHRVFNDGKRDWVYIVMEYIEGPNLETLRQQQPEQRFIYLEAINFLAPIIDAVRYLHRQQPPIIHRDIRPANIIMPRTGARAVLVNLGIGKEYSQDSTAAMVQSYSPNYRAPELYSGGGDIRTDIYGLGATFYTLVMGIVPTDARSRMTQLDSTGVDPLKPVHEVVPTIPVLVVRAIYKAMAIQAYNRFSSVGQFWEELWVAALNPLSAEQPSPAFTPTSISNASEKKSMPSAPAPPSTAAGPERAVEQAATTPLPQPPVAHMPDTVKEQKDLDATEPLPKLPPGVPKLDDVKEQEDLDTTRSLPKLPPAAPLNNSNRIIIATDRVDISFFSQYLHLYACFL
jgi:serine/threonine protein kinase